MHHRSAADVYRFCPKCGFGLESKSLKEGEPQRLVCPGCDFIFYLDPKVAACTICMLDGGIVLLKRGIEPQMGKWVFPGGFVDRGEPVADAAIRETREETNLKVSLTGILESTRSRQRGGGGGLRGGGTAASPRRAPSAWRCALPARTSPWSEWPSRARRRAQGLHPRLHRVRWRETRMQRTHGSRVPLPRGVGPGAESHAPERSWARSQHLGAGLKAGLCSRPARARRRCSLRAGRQRGRGRPRR